MITRIPRSIREPLLLLTLQGSAVLSTAINPFMPLIITGGLATILLLLYYNQVLLILLASVGLVKGAAIAQFPIFKTIDLTVLISVLVILVLAWKLANPQARRHVMQYQYIIAGFLIWVVWMITSSLYAPFLDWALIKSFRFALFTTTLFLGPLVMVQSREASNAMLRIFLAVGLLGAVYIIGQMLIILRSASIQQGIIRLSILSANPIGAGRVLSICAAMAAIVIVTDMGKFKHWGPLLILFLVTALLTGSRGPILALVAATVLLGLILGGTARRRTIYILGLMIVAIGLVLVVAPEGLTSRYRLYMEGELAATQQGLVVLNTVVHRIVMWHKALALWTSDLPHFIMGTGTAGYIIAFPWRDIEYPHNLPLELLAEFGLIGLGVFSLHICLIAKRTIHRFRSRFQREELLWLTGALTMFFAALVSGDLNDNRLLWFFLGGLLATVSVGSGPQPQEQLH